MVVMSRLAGAPLRGTALGSDQLSALAEAVTRLHDAVPPDVLHRIPPRPGRQSELVKQVTRWGEAFRPLATGPVRQAMDAGCAWLARSGLGAGSGAGAATGAEAVGSEVPAVPAVFGPGDGNLANYLWDGSRVQVVDFEESGRSDRAFELAEITEHVGSWVEHPLDVRELLDRFDLSPAEKARLRECRRLLALVWLFMLAGDDPAHPRNPPGSAQAQAGRLLELLN
jgi:Ser/Thr protein kinase RdoA (MazF antagonist)